METTIIAGPRDLPVSEVVKVGRVDPALKEEVRRREAGLPSNGDYRLPARAVDATPEPEKTYTPAMLRLHELRQRQNQSSAPPPRIVTREYQGEQWYFNRLDYAPLALARHDVSEALGDDPALVLRSITRSALAHVVCKSATDSSPYFQAEDVEAWLSEPADGEFFELLDWLTNEALTLNPDMVPKVPVAETAGTPSSISQPANDETGSSATSTTPSAAKSPSG